jgi:stage II sporulation protein R
MKKVCISFLALAIIVLSVVGIGMEKPQPEREYLRIHIRANSNLQNEQEVKYKVKDKIIEYLTPYIVQCDTKQKAKTLLTTRLEQIEFIANRELKQNGFDYTANASVKKETFPTRVYDGVELKSGVYEALIIQLGSGEGDNWWCVVYPPLCFATTDANVVYKSKIKEIIERFYN